MIEVPIDRLNGIDLESVPSAWGRMEGVSQISILEITGQVLVYCVDESITLDSLIEALPQGDEGASDQNSLLDRQPVTVIDSDVQELIHLRIRGMHCASCEHAIETVVSGLDGVSSVKAEVITGRATVTGTGVSTLAVTEALSGAGYQADVIVSRANLSENIRDMHRRNERKLRRRWVLALLCVLLLMFSLWFKPDYELWGVIVIGFATVVQLACGGPYLLSAFRLARYRQANMDTLIALGTTAAFVGALVFEHHGDYHMLMESPMILAVVSFGKWLESLSINRAVGQLVTKADSQGTVLRVLPDGSFADVCIEQVTAGMQVVIRSGERVQLDGNVTGGNAVVSRAWLTGETGAIDLSTGELVHAGEVNEGERFTIEVTSEAGATRYDQIMERLEKSLGQRPQIQQLADKVVSVFVPTLIILASFTFGGWVLLGEAEYADAWRFTVAVLVIACPCALGLATPVATLVSGTRALRLGALITNPGAMEQLAKVRKFVLDKTGTLTSPRLEVQTVELLDNTLDLEYLLQLVCGLEQQFTHPIAKSILDYCGQRELVIAPLAVSDTETLPGTGIRGVVAEQSLAVVNDGFVVRQFEMDIDAEAGVTRSWVLLDGRVVACFSLAASCYPGVQAVVHALQEHCEDTEHVILASGDSDAACQQTAMLVGINKVYSEMTPEGKVELVASLQATGDLVAIVGDGINDAVALAEADVGIAVYGGSDVAVQSAGVVLLQPGLDIITDLISLSQKTRMIIRQNLGWAFIYNLLAIPLAAGLFTSLGVSLTPMLAAGIMATSSILVVLNSLRLSRIPLI